MKEEMMEKEITFQIKTIELLNFEMNYPDNQLPEQTTFHFNINLEQRINPENKLIVVVTTVNVMHQDKKTKLASLKASCIFEITNIDDFFNQDTKQIALPENAVIMFNSISISTVRGIMFTQFKGTFLHNAVLPVIDPKGMLKMKKIED
jgi:hypothetical protein